MGCADAVAVSDGGETLHVGVEQHRQRGRFSFTKLRELSGDRLHRAVVLAELGAGSDGVDGGGVALSGERAGQLTGISDGRRVKPGSHPLRELGGALPSEGGNGLLASVLREEPERADSEFVIRSRSSGMTGRCKDVIASRTATATLHLRRARAAGADDAVRDHRVEVTPDSRGRETEALAQLRCGGGTELYQQLGDTVTGAGVDGLRGRIYGLVLMERERRCFHNVSVP